MKLRDEWGGSVKKLCDNCKEKFAVVGLNGEWLCLDCYDKRIMALAKMLRATTGKFIAGPHEVGAYYGDKTKEI